MNRDKEIKNIIISSLSSLDCEAIYLFGSYGKGKEHNNSDIDIAFLSFKSYDDYEIFILAQTIGRLLNKEIDLIQLKDSSTVFQKEVVTGGTLLFEKNRMERENFEMVVLKKYTRLNEERASILENYERRYYHQ